MTESTPKIGFWQFPITLKFVVIWTGLLGLYEMGDFIKEINDRLVDHVVAINPLVAAGINFVLMIGLINKWNVARICASISYGLGLVAMAIFIGSAPFELPPGFIQVYLIFNYIVPMTESMIIAFYGLFIVFNAIFVYVLLRPSTKALFSPQPVSSFDVSPQDAK
jgi:hypothetical protein